MLLLVVSTKTSLGPLIKAVEDVKKNYNVDLELKIYYTHELDETQNLINELSKDLERADIVLIDVRTPTSKFVQVLDRIRYLDNIKVSIPLVVGSGTLLRYLKLGKITGDKIVSKMREYDFDSQNLDIRDLQRILTIGDKITRIIPAGSLRDFRNYILAVKYWSYGTYNNYKNLILMILREYFNYRELKYDEPTTEIQPYSIWVPHKNLFEKNLKSIDFNPDKPTIAILMYAGMHFEQCRPVAEKMFYELRERVNVVPIVGGGNVDLADQARKLGELLDRIGLSSVDVLVNLQWFRINGGPYGGPSEPTYDLLRRLDCILINGLIMYMREVEKWRRDPRGIAPIEVVTAVALPEIDGAIEPIPVAGLSSDISKDIVIIDDRFYKKVCRIVNWIKLRREHNSRKRVAIIIYNYPPGEHNIGSASYLDVFKSLEVILRALEENGYTTTVVDKEKLVEIFQREGILNSPHWHVHSKDLPSLSTDEYVQLLKRYVPEKLVREVIKVWGEPPGDINVSRDRVVIPGVILGNVFIGVQPSRGVHEDPKKLYHSKDLPPHHQYIAFYLWLKDKFKADVIVHLGTHGTLEFMPGKEVGLSDKCWPDLLVQDLPHVYVYHVTNPSEMTIAKRRSYAYIVTHSTPPFTVSDLYGDYSELEELLHEYEEAQVQDPERAKVVLELIKEKCRKLNIEYSSIEELHDKLFEIARSIIPKGLHYLGREWTEEEIVDYITLVLRYDREVKSLHRLICENINLNYDELLEKPHAKIGNKLAKDVLREIEHKAREIVRLVVQGRKRDVFSMFSRGKRREIEEVMAFIEDLYSRVKRSDEICSLLRALSGRYVQPRVAGDPIRTPEVFPTGSHGYAFDPRLIPSKAAYIRGARIAETTLRMYYQRYGRYPETVAVVLWGFETMGTRGETIGQVLQYLGVRLVRKHGPWDWGLEPIPLEELGRPRIDVVVTICGIFRDTFPNLITLLDRAFSLVASLDEPPEMNYVRKHVEEVGSRCRIFGPKIGAYNTRLPEIIESSEWSERRQLAETYLEDMSYAYSETEHGVDARDVFRRLLSKVDLVTQIRYAHEYDIIDLDHYYEFLGGLKLAVEETRGRKVDTLWIDTTLEKEKVRDLRDAIDLSVRTRVLNPKWIDSMLEHGYDGAREIAKRVEYVVGLAALTSEVPTWIFEKLYETYIESSYREKIHRASPAALYEIAKRLYEAHLRGFWNAGERLKTLERIIEELEKELEE